MARALEAIHAAGFIHRRVAAAARCGHGVCEHSSMPGDKAPASPRPHIPRRAGPLIRPRNADGVRRRRDIKPHNIIRTGGGGGGGGGALHRLVDFGSATGVSGCLFGGFAAGAEPAAEGDEEDVPGADEASECALEDSAMDGPGGQRARAGMAGAFAAVDADRSGKLDADELLRSLRAAGARPDPAEGRRLVAKYDLDGDGARRGARAADG